jgi:hypothetical protein
MIPTKSAVVIFMVAFVAVFVVTCGDGGGKSDSGATIPVTKITVPDTGQTASYTTVFGEDSDYTINPMSFTDNGDGTISDNVTGFMWQKRDDGVPRTWSDALGYCDALTLGNQTDWRLPETFELMTIVDYGQYYPVINLASFPSTSAADYWSATISRWQAGYAWAVDFFVGITTENSQSSMHNVRCIRGDVFITKSYTNNLDGTVKDNTTNLFWQKAIGGQANWVSAIAYCENLILGGFTDWRLPNIKELRSLIFDSSKYTPAIDTSYFDFGYTYGYWSSTGNGNRAWIVYFDTGGVWDGHSITYSNSIRCVRGTGS